MNHELDKCYDLLGLGPGASHEEVKVAYRDLAKVWHPDRFLHDPRLQAKAQEKLKEINEAYDQLGQRRAKPPTQPSAWSSERHRHAQAQAQTGSVAIVQRTPWRWMLGSVLIFAAVFLVTSRSLPRPRQQEYQSRKPAMEQAQAPPDQEPPQQSGSNVNTAAGELLHGKDRIEVKSHTKESGGASKSQPSAALLRPLPTVTVVIDPSTGMIARRACPMKTTMTYPSGNEPHQYCALHPEATTAPAPAAPKDSRLKSAAKRLASPDKWFGGGAKSDAAIKQDSKSP